MYATRLVTAPNTEPVTLAEAKTHLRVTAADDDTYITALIKGARQHCEVVLNRALLQQDWDLFFDCFPDVIRVPMPPLQSITSVKYIDLSGTLQTLDPTGYAVDKNFEPGRIKPAYGTSWPSIR